MLNYIKSVLDFSAFRPELDDPSFPWSRRCGKKPTALIQLGRSALSVASVDRKGDVISAEKRRGDARELLLDLGPMVKDASPENLAVLSIDTRYIITIESNIVRKKGSEEAVKTDPRSVLHSRYERGKSYALTHNPESNSTLLCSFDAEFVKKTESVIKEKGIKLGRICCGTYVLLRHALTVTNAKKGLENPFSALYVVSCGGSVCALLQEKDNWLEIRSRADVFAEDIRPMIELVAPFQEKLSQDAGLVVACDEPIEGFPEALAEAFPGRAINDLTKPGFLAHLVFRN